MRGSITFGFFIFSGVGGFLPVKYSKIHPGMQQSMGIARPEYSKAKIFIYFFGVAAVRR